MTRQTLKNVGFLLVPLVMLLIAACQSDTSTGTSVNGAAPTTVSEPASIAATPVPTSVATPVPTPAATPIPTPAATPVPTLPVVSPPAGAEQPQQKLSVVTTSNIIADWVRAVGQERVEVFPMLPTNADPHTYQPGARDITRVADADLVMSVGLSLESGWLDELIANSARNPDSVVALGELVDPIDFVAIYEEHHEEGAEALAGRLLIGDGETGAMSVIDLEHGDVEQDAFDLGSRAGRIYSTKNRRFAIAVSSDANQVHIFDGGLYLEAHGDHFDQVEGPVKPLNIDLAGDNPAHLYVGSEYATVFYDGSGDLALISEHELAEEGEDYLPQTINAGPHHGAAVPLAGGLFAVTLQHPDYASDPAEYRLPTGAQIVNLAGEELHRETGCDGLHGDAGNGHIAVFGCFGGVLMLEAHDGAYDGAFIAAPEGEPEDFRLTSVWGYPGMEQFFALGSSVGLYVVEPEAGAIRQMIPATESLQPINFAISHDGEYLLVVMNTGELRMYDAHDLELLASAGDFLAAPVETGFWARPHLTTAPGAVFITDSVGGKVFQLDDHDLEIVNSWDVAGNPTKIAFVGIPGETADHEEKGHEDHDGEKGDHEGEEHEEDGHADHDGEEGAHEENGHEDHDAGEASHDHDHAHGTLDPHFWFDPIRVKQAVNSIAARLSAADPAGQSSYTANAAAYNRQLDNLHNWIVEQVAILPEERRALVTSHDSFQYFAQRYGFEVVGAVFPAVTTEVEPTAQELAMLIETIEHEGVPAVFTEKSHSQRLAERVAEETGANLIGGLYTGSLGEAGGEAGNYIALMRYNTTTIVEALR